MVSCIMVHGTFICPHDLMIFGYLAAAAAFVYRWIKG